MCYCSLTAGGVLCRPNIARHCSFIARTRGGRQTNIGWGGEGGGRNRRDIGCFSLSFVSRHRHLRSRWPCIQKHSTGTKTYTRDCHSLNFLIYSPFELPPNSPQLHNQLTRTRATAQKHFFSLACPPTITLILTQRHNKPSYYTCRESAESIATEIGKGE